MNAYLKNLSKIEFVITDACTGRCKHCSEGYHSTRGIFIDPTVAANAVGAVCAEYDVRTVMCFGGEPLLYPDAVFEIIGTATALNVEKRQVITNGYFSSDEGVIADIAGRLADCGVNDLLISVDAFHQETIPLDVVRSFAKATRSCGIPTRLQPAWLVRCEDDNPYNRSTRHILEKLSDIGIPTGEGNVVFFEGNAKKHLAQYFTESLPENPYTEDPCDVKCLSFSPSGDVLNSNIYKKDIMEIIKDYAP